MNGEPIKVFLSYNHQDAEIAERIKQSLAGAGIDVWRDGDEIRGGDTWQERVEEAVASADAALVLIGLHPKGWQNEEIRLLLDQHVRNQRPRVVPILVPGGREEDIPPLLSSKHWIDCRDGWTDAALDDVFFALKGRRYRQAPGDERVEVGKSRRRSILLAAFLFGLLAIAGYRLKSHITSAPAEPAVAIPAAELGFEPKVSLPRPSVAILSFVNDGSETAAWLATALREALGAKLGWDGAVRVVDGQDVAWVERDLFPADLWDLEADAVRKVHRILGAGHVIAGRLKVQESLGKVGVELQLYDGGTGELLTAWSDSGEMSNLLVRIDRLTDGTETENLRRRLGAEPLRLPDEESFRQWFPEDLATLRVYSQAVHDLQQDRPRQAFDGLSHTPNVEHPLVALALAEAAVRTGDWERAANALQSAEEGFAQMASGIHSSIPGRIFESKVSKLAAALSEEPEKELQALQRRFAEYFPDDLAHGFRWAEQASFLGGPRYTRDILSLLRRFFPIGEDHVWLDLLEADALLHQAEHGASCEMAGMALERARELGLPWSQARAHLATAVCLDAQGGRAAEDPEPHLAASRRLFEEVGDATNAARGLELSASFYEHFDLARARSRYRQALEIYRSVGAPFDALRMCVVLGLLADSIAQEGTECNELLARMPHEGSTIEIAHLENERGFTFHLAGALEPARRHYEEARRLFEKAEATDFQALMGTNLGELDFLQGRLDQALEKHREALENQSELGWIAFGQYGEGKVLVAQGDVVSGMTSYRAALPNSSDEYAWEPDEDGATFVEAHLGLAEADVYRRRAREALERLATIENAVVRFGDSNLESRLHATKAQAYLALEEIEEAREAAAAAKEEAEEARLDGNKDFRALWTAEIVMGQVQALSEDTREEGSQTLQAVAAKAAEAGARGFELEALLALGHAELEQGRTSSGRCRLILVRHRAAGAGGAEPPYPLFGRRVDQVRDRFPGVIPAGPPDATMLEQCRETLRAS